MQNAARIEDAPHAARLAEIRGALVSLKLDGLLLPRADEYQNENLPPSAARMEWLTGFTGSWGFVAVLKDKAAAFVDGRYTIQATQQIDASLFEIVCTVDVTVEDWLAANVPQGAKLGYDPWLFTKDRLAKVRSALAPLNVELVSLDKNPIDSAWSNRPSPPLSPVKIHEDKYTGASVSEKLKQIRDSLGKAGATHLVITQTDNLAWTFNVRGADIENTPLTFGFAVISADKATIFMDARKVSDSVRNSLAKDAVFEPLDQFQTTLKTLRSDAKVIIDPKASVVAIRDAVKASGASLLEISDPVTMAKAQKNATELQGARDAHRRDGAAMVNFLYWFDKADKSILSEIDLDEALYRFRKATNALQDISFESIVGSGPNGAIAHYRVSHQSSRKLDMNNLIVVDSGGQYLDGTTDITRTLVVGTPTKPMTTNFTRVLQGMIAVTLARFPKGTSGVQLDILARQAFWQAGLDYDHGTGHGVGSYLGVHEGPSRISKIPSPPLLSGMILSNEPGYYEENGYGIRIENLVIVKEPEIPAGGTRPMHSFETLTLCPIARDAIDVSMLSATERNWLNAYHARVLEEISPLVASDVQAFLKEACAPL